MNSLLKLQEDQEKSLDVSSGLTNILISNQHLAEEKQHLNICVHGPDRLTDVTVTLVFTKTILDLTINLSLVK